jgi:hypothetical protein
MSACDICIAELRTIKTQEDQMKQWIAGHILTADDFRMEEIIPISNKELTVSLSMVCAALALFAIIVRVLGA